MVVGTKAASSPSSPRRESTPAVPSAPKNVTARSVTLTSTSGCEQRGLRGGPGGGGFNGTPPAGGLAATPPARGSTGTPPAGGFRNGDGPGGFRGRFGGVLGTITSITGDSFKVKSSFSASVSTSNLTTTVRTTAGTAYVEIETASASDVAKGSCVSAVGATDVGGVLQARTVSISPPVKGECRAASGTFGGGFGGRGTGAGAPPASGEAGSGGV
jgi:hypothetical protein